MGYNFKIDKEKLAELFQDIMDEKVNAIINIVVSDDGYCVIATDNGAYYITQD